MHVHTNDLAISQSDSIANNKSPPPIISRDHPWTRIVLLDSSAGPVPSSPKNQNPTFTIIGKL